MTSPTDPRLSLLDAESPMAAQLAELASLAVRIDTGLLRRLRLEFLAASDADIESELWFSPIVESRSDRGFQIYPELLPTLRGRLKKSANRPSIDAVRAVVAEAHVGISPAIALEERVNAIALAHGAEGRSEIDQALRPAVATVARGGLEAIDIARWAIFATPRLDPIVLECSNTKTLMLASALLLRRRPRMGDVRESGSSMSALGWALPAIDPAAKTTIGVDMIPGGLQFCGREEASITIDVPSTDPAVVEIEWGGTHRMLTEATPGTLIALEGHPEIVTITTLAGDQYRLTVSPDASESPRRHVPERPTWAGDLCMQVSAPDKTRLSVAFSVDPHLVLTVRAPVREYPLVTTGFGVVALRVLEWHDGESDEGHEDEFVGLTPSIASFSESFRLGDGHDEQITRAFVCGFINDRDEWFEVLLEAPPPGSWSYRRGVLMAPPALPAAALSAAFVGGPLVVGNTAIGAILDIVAPTGRDSYATLRFVSPSYLRSAVVRAQAKLKRDDALHSEAPPPVLEAQQPSVAESSARIFISSNLIELRRERRAVESAISALGQRPVTYEKATRRGEDWAEFRARELDTSDVFVGIVGYTFIMNAETPENPDGLPMWVIEYRRARELHKPCFMFFRNPHDADYPAPDRVREFRAEVARDASVTEFDSPDELAKLAQAVLGEWVSVRRNDELYSLAPESPDAPTRIAILSVARDGGSVLSFSSRNRHDVVQLRDGATLSAAFLHPTVELGAQLVADVLPASIRELWRTATALHLTVDDATARFPWELAQDLERSPGPNTAITRNLASDHSSWDATRSLRRAFIAGPIKNPYANMPASVDSDEIRGVSDMLRALGQQPAGMSGAAAEGIERSMQEFEYDIVHFSGYTMGQIASSGPAAIRITTSESRPPTYLTVDAFRRLKRPPALVFMNCPPDNQLTPDSRGAIGGYALDLVRLGVRMVIWPAFDVTEIEAQTFSVAFYRGLMSGRTYGESVHDARRAVAALDFGSVAWAAYQCYGEPGYTSKGALS